jgi:hypothetical protein
VCGSGAGTIQSVKPAGQYRVFVRFALLDDVPAPLAVYPPDGVVTDPTQLQGSALAFTIIETTCSDPASQTPNSDGDVCKCQKGFFDADKDDGETICEPCAVGTYRDDIEADTCTPCGTSTTTLNNASNAATLCVCNVGYFSDALRGCVDCEKGTYNDVKDAAACTLCPAGTQSQKGAASVDQCSLCPALSVASFPGTSECQDCGANVNSPIGSTRASPDRTDCECTDGFYMDLGFGLGANKTCRTCPSRGATCTKDRIVGTVRHQGHTDGSHEARGDRNRSLNDRHTPHCRSARVRVSTGYSRVEGNRRASRNGRVSSLPPEIH